MHVTNATCGWAELIPCSRRAVQAGVVAADALPLRAGVVAAPVHAGVDAALVHAGVDAALVHAGVVEEVAAPVVGPGRCEGAVGTHKRLCGHTHNIMNYFFGWQRPSTNQPT